MNRNNRLIVRCVTLRSIALTLGCCLVLPAALRAQGVGVTCSTYPGDKTVWGTSTSNPISAHDYIDASVYYTGNNDVCGPIASALTDIAGGSSTNTGCATPFYHARGLIDARGIFPSAGSNLTCSTNPFQGGKYNGQTPYVTVLLPAGTIGINSTWVLQQNMHIVGEGSNVTTLQASSFTGSAIMYMGDDPSFALSVCVGDDCNGIAIEHLRLDGGNISGLDGIFNNSAQELNYVNDVQITNIAGTGLRILGQLDLDTNQNPLGFAVNSGPYTNISYSGTGTCVNINGTYGTRGVHGLTCTGTSSPTGPAILLDGNNTTLQDVFITGYTGDGVLLGSQGTYAQNNLLFNVTGDTTLAKVVHIQNSSAPPSDLTLMGIRSNSTSTSKYTVYDEVTSSFLKSSSTEQNVGLYVLGDAVAVNSTQLGYSRFTTSSSVPAWYVGSAQPTGACTTSGLTVVGSLYSVTSSFTSGSTLWGCIPTSTGNNWVSLTSK